MAGKHLYQNAYMFLEDKWLMRVGVGVQDTVGCLWSVQVLGIDLQLICLHYISQTVSGVKQRQVEKVE
jgi:hypothetical protein